MVKEEQVSLTSKSVTDLSKKLIHTFIKWDCYVQIIELGH